MVVLVLKTDMCDQPIGQLTRWLTRHLSLSAGNSFYFEPCLLLNFIHNMHVACRTYEDENALYQVPTLVFGLDDVKMSDLLERNWLCRLYCLVHWLGRGVGGGTWNICQPLCMPQTKANRQAVHTCFFGWNSTILAFQLGCQCDWTVLL